mmetsp:Transcript_98995/g.285692  ORF Transcript_98995/g.285692 Transcript_98995/m.285692 type:complete len:293 (+) Transcript_98995:178-1056(+)
MKAAIIASLLLVQQSLALVPFIDGGKGMPKLYNGWFNEQVSKQASSAVSRAIAAGATNIEVNFPPVPNVDEVKFGTPLNQKFGKSVVARDLGIPGGYKPGSDVSRQLIAYSNIYWAKRIGASASGAPLGGKPVCCLSAEPVNFNLIKSSGCISRFGSVMSQEARKQGRNGEVILCVNPGGEETWDRLVSAHGSPGAPFIVMNNAYSTTYNLGNKRGFEEAYYLKRISKGWVFRSFPGPWCAYLERPDGTVELLKSYDKKPELREIATLVREESFQRYAINNDRWTPGFGERL